MPIRNKATDRQSGQRFAAILGIVHQAGREKEKNLRKASGLLGSPPAEGMVGSLLPVSDHQCAREGFLISGNY